MSDEEEDLPGFESEESYQEWERKQYEEWERKQYEEWEKQELANYERRIEMEIDIFGEKHERF